MTGQELPMYLTVLAIARCSTPFIFASLGAMISQSTGSINYALEGVMVTSALITAFVAGGSGSVFLAACTGISVGTLIGFGHAYLSQRLKLNSTYSGLCLTMCALGATAALGAMLPGGRGIHAAVSPVTLSFHDSDVFVLAAGMLVCGTYFYLKRSHSGLSLRALANDRKQAVSAGVKVEPLMLGAAAFASAIAAMAGAFLPLGLYQGWHDGISGGRGFIAVALALAIGCSPWRALLFSLIVGAAQVLQAMLFPNQQSSVGDLVGLAPYVVTIGLVVVTALTRSVISVRVHKNAFNNIS